MPTPVTTEQIQGWLEAARKGETPQPILQPHVHAIAKRLGPEKVAEICRRYAAGEIARQLAAEFGVAQTPLIGLLRANHVMVRQQSPTQEQKVAIVRGYQSGKTIAQLEQEMGISHGSIWRALRAAGVEMRPKGWSGKSTRPGLSALRPTEE